MDAVETIEREATTIDDTARVKYHAGRTTTSMADLALIRDRHRDSDIGRQLSLAITELENAELRLNRAAKLLEG